MEKGRILTRLAPLLLTGALIAGDSTFFPKTPGEIANHNSNLTLDLMVKASVGLTNLRYGEIPENELQELLHGQSLGTFYVDERKPIRLSLGASGEPIYQVLYPYETALVRYSYGDIDYPPRRISESHNYLLCYGESLDPLCAPNSANIQTIQQFLKEYFIESQAPVNVMHLDARDEPLWYSDIGNLEVFPSALQEEMGTVGVVRDLDTDEVRRLDVIFRLSSPHSKAATISLPLEKALIDALVNQKVDYMLTLSPGRDAETTLQSQALSSLMGLAAMTDPDGRIAADLLGPAHRPFVDLLTYEMESQAEIVRR